MRKTPFSLVYGSEAVLLAEIGLYSCKIEFFKEELNEQVCQEELDTIDEPRFEVAESMACARQSASKHYNAKFKAKLFFVGDWVLRKDEFKGLTHHNKLTPKCEGSV
ncbi:hypothetical protein CRG98_022066 [Punica granatum]|uniref:Uncharacterized protein n=1 Tax=Punica granatum TaxID=22663 RepID=A0A2I0JMT9_PUNGR|nr:hypothetical protein CRG98_022066 [Punica granatum]